MKRAIQYILLGLTAMIGLGGECAKNIIDPPKEPVIEEISVFPQSPVNPGDTVTVTVIATNPEEGALEYKWTINGGTLIHPIDTAIVRWKMPVEGGNYRITVKVTNQKDKSATTSREIRVISTALPYVEIISPTEGEYFVQYNDIQINAIAYHGDGLSEVRLFINDSLKQTLAGHLSENYSFNADLADYVGVTKLTIRAISNYNGLSNEKSVHIIVEGIVPGLQ